MSKKTGRRSAHSAKTRSNWGELFCFVLLVLGVWIFSLLVWGQQFNMRGVTIAQIILNFCGWAAFVPLFFFIYVCVFKFFGFSVGNFFGKFCGVATLFFVTSLVLGIKMPLNAGSLGFGLAKSLTANVGMVSTVIVAVLGVFTAAAFLRIPLVSALIVTPIRWLVLKFSDWTENVIENRRYKNIELQKRKRRDELIAKSQRRKKPLTDEVSIELDSPAEAEASEIEEKKSPAEDDDDLKKLPTTQELLKIYSATLNKKNPPSEQPPILPPPMGSMSLAAQEPKLPEITEPQKVIEPQKMVSMDIVSGAQETAPEPEMPEDEEQISVEGLFPPSIEIFGPQLEDADSSEIKNLANSQGEKIVETLKDFGVKADVAEIVIGPSVVQFQIQLAPGIRVNKIAGLANDLAMSLAVVSVRVEAPIPGKPYVGIEIPNVKRRGIPLRSVVESLDYQENRGVLPMPMGMRVDSRFMVIGLEDMPHMLVAGTTGSGKSVFTNTCIIGMCNKRTPDELKLILVDPKHVEFAIYDGLPHLLARPISDPKKAVSALGWAVQQMETRGEMFAAAKVRNLDSYNEKLLPKHRLPYIVIVVDELADLMYTAGKEVESLIARLAQKARSAGIHLILATQRPSVDVITGLIKANIPARVAFAVPSQTDSRTIIDTGGADKLLGKGDMLFLSTKYPRPVRLQASFINEERTLAFIESLKQSFGAPEYVEFEEYKGESNGKNKNENNGDGKITLDPKIEEALNFIMDTGIASASKLQTIMGIGYPRASRIISTLEQLGVLGPQPSSPTKPREILMDGDDAFERIDEARN